MILTVFYTKQDRGDLQKKQQNKLLLILSIYGKIYKYINGNKLVCTD